MSVPFFGRFLVVETCGQAKLSVVPGDSKLNFTHHNSALLSLMLLNMGDLVMCTQVDEATVGNGLYRILAPCDPGSKGDVFSNIRLVQLHTSPSILRTALSPPLGVPES